MIYLDNSATTRTFDIAAQTALRYMTETYFNPSGAYSVAVESERNIEAARLRLAAAMNASAGEIIYTSGGTESNNMAILGALEPMREKGTLIMSAVEHPSVYEVMRAVGGGYEFVEAPVNRSGGVDLDKLAQVVNEKTRLVSIMHVNNESGAINDLKAIQGIVKRAAPSAVFHSDGVQAFLKVPFDAKTCDMYSISGHKFHAPKGVGALYVRSGLRFAGGQKGGGQERNLRSGTTNSQGIMGMDAAITYYLSEQKRFLEQMRACKKRLAENLLRIKDVLINGPAPADGAPHILNASFMGVRGEVLLHALEEKQIYVSTGSACSAHKKGKNRILTAMGVVGERQDGAIRFSLCPFNTIREMDETAAAIDGLVTSLRRFKRR